MNKSDYRIGVGASSILMILVALAMAALSLLTFGSARDTETLTRRNVEMSQSYYEAAAETQRKIARIDEVVLEYRQAFPGKAARADWFEALALDGVEWREEDGALLFSLALPAGGERELRVLGRVLTQGERRYELLEHATCDTSAWDGTQNFELMGE